MNAHNSFITPSPPSPSHPPSPGTILTFHTRISNSSPSSTVNMLAPLDPLPGLTSQHPSSSHSAIFLAFCLPATLSTPLSTFVGDAVGAGARAPRGSRSRHLPMQHKRRGGPTRTTKRKAKSDAAAKDWDADQPEEP